jgi:hypothetical protein
MSLASPTALFWFAAAIPIIGFYILKIRLRRVPVSTILFWRQVYQENQPRSLFQRMRHWVSLLVQLSLLCLLVLALADPFLAWEIRQRRRVVIVLDNSASMNATDVTPSRLAAAKIEASRIVDGLRFRDEVAVISAGGVPQVACGFSNHRRTLASAIEGVNPTDNPTRVRDAIELARRLLGDSEGDHQRQVVVLSDRRADTEGSAIEPLSESDSRRNSSLQVITRQFGTPAANVGITRFQPRRSLIDPLSYQILIEVTNASDESVECRLDIDLNEHVIDVLPLKLAAGERWSHVLEKTSAEGGRLVAKLDRADVLTADNQAWAILPALDPIPVTLVSEGNLYLQKVLESHPLVQLSRGDPAVWNASSASGRGITVLHRHVPDGPFPRGRFLVIDPRASCELWQVGEPLSNPLIGVQNKEFLTSILSHVRLENVLLPEARQVKFADESLVKVVARAASGDPLLAIIERPETKVLLLTVNLDEGDLPLRTAFPILISNALNWLTGNRGELRETLTTGAIAEFDVKSLTKDNQIGSRGLSLVAPDGRRSPLPIGRERLTIGPLDQCGLWRIEPDHDSSNNGAAITNNHSRVEPVLELACNLANRDASDIRVHTEMNLQPLELQSAGLFGNRPLSVWLIACAWGLMVVEWWAYQRRWLE